MSKRNPMPLAVDRGPRVVHVPCVTRRGSAAQDLHYRPPPLDVPCPQVHLGDATKDVGMSDLFMDSVFFANFNLQHFAAMARGEDSGPKKVLTTYKGHVYELLDVLPRNKLEGFTWVGQYVVLHLGQYGEDLEPLCAVFQRRKGSARPPSAQEPEAPQVCGSGERFRAGGMGAGDASEAHGPRRRTGTSARSHTSARVEQRKGARTEVCGHRRPGQGVGGAHFATGLVRCGKLRI